MLIDELSRADHIHAHGTLAVVRDLQTLVQGLQQYGLVDSTSFPVTTLYERTMSGVPQWRRHNSYKK
ncbi:uncharacterized protein G2W53_031621 [Senna tora]|uniref:Uncharacterized protein n=1 Tax=Senna tora TaxID=362788 RepID=A0A834TB46_9FABA|nr:uncharacterized protein G2W53_031621 [Senna tora]